MDPASCQKGSYGSRCQFGCNPNFFAVGADTILCQANRQWSESSFLCQVRTCSRNSLKYDRISSSTNCSEKLVDFQVDSVCATTCLQNYHSEVPIGIHTCQRNGQWLSSPINCRLLTCPIMVPPANAELLSSRSPTFVVNQQSCFKCIAGFTQVQSDCFRCVSSKNGSLAYWESYDPSYPYCVDHTRPTFHHPNCSVGDFIHIKVNNAPGQVYGIVRLPEVLITDATGIQSTFSDPAGYQLNNSDYYIPITKPGMPMSIRITAVDNSNLVSYCVIKVEVRDTEPPVIEGCHDIVLDIPPGKKEVSSSFESPKVSDNCRCPVTLFPNQLLGPYLVAQVINMVYTAMDSYGNVASCSFIITVRESISICSQLFPPLNGVLVTTRQNFVMVTCRPNYSLRDGLGNLLLKCNSGAWELFGTGPEGLEPNNIHLVQCIANESPDGSEVTSTGVAPYSGPCDDGIIEHAKSILEQERFLDLCNAVVDDPSEVCSEDQFQFFCGKSTVVMRRRRSVEHSVYIKAKVRVHVSRNTTPSQLGTAVQKLVSKMSSKFLPLIQKKLLGDNSLGTLVDKRIGQISQLSPGAQTQMACRNLAATFSASKKFERACAQCPPGTSFDLATESCKLCPVNTYQPLYGQLGCLPCPEGTITLGLDNQNTTSCRELCRPGEYSPFRSQPCQLCSIGTYSSIHGATSCQRCPDGLTTIKPGAKSEWDCGSPCRPGSYSHAGVEPCEPCPRGTYQSQPGQDICSECPGITTTLHEGTDSISYCEVINFCRSSPCLNGGSCFNYKNTFRCECQKGFYGPVCESESDECFSMLCANDQVCRCKNGGTCVDKVQNFTCLCREGTDGRNCERTTPHCASNPCVRGQCVMTSVGPSCICEAGYTGEFCERLLDPCSPNPCQSGGVCIPKGNSYSCLCPSNRLGTVCEVLVIFCASQPCRNGATCMESTAGPVCTCADGYHGRYCQEKIDYCSVNPCSASGVCVNGERSRKCLCSPTWGGPSCTEILSWDFDVSFQSRNTPSYVSRNIYKNLAAFTLSLWIRTMDDQAVGTMFSYAVLQPDGVLQDNAITLSNQRSLELVINNNTAYLGVKVVDAAWHHIVITWESLTGRFLVYKDGEKAAEGILSKGTTVYGNGIALVGEEQDALGDRFSMQQSFYGDVSQLNLWDSVFSVDDLSDLLGSCGSKQGNVAAWGDFRENLFGGTARIVPLSSACRAQDTRRTFYKLTDVSYPENLQIKYLDQELSNIDEAACVRACGARHETCRSAVYKKESRLCKMLQASTVTLDELQVFPLIGTNVHTFALSSLLDLADLNRFPDNLFTASSSAAGYPPQNVRYGRKIVTDGAASIWVPATTSASEYLDIDLRKVTVITAIGTLGSGRNNIPWFMSDYTIMYKNLSEEKWTVYKRLSGNKDLFNIHLNEVFLIARFIRFTNMLTSSKIALSLELYGFPYDRSGMHFDADPCSSSPCKNGGTCVALLKGFSCICQAGFHQRLCEASLSCGDPGIPLNGFRTNRISEISFGCNPGFMLLGPSSIRCMGSKWNQQPPLCVDVNECLYNPCMDNCINLPGSYMCTCPGGYRRGSSENVCENGLDCSLNNGGCQYTCHLMSNAVQCSCPTGLQLVQGRFCEDVNECLGNHGCQHQCRNLPTGYQCLCPTGFTLAKDQRSCTPLSCTSAITGSIAVGQGADLSRSCPTGRKLSTSPYRVCLPDLTLSGLEIGCQDIYCPSFGTFPHGSVMVHSDSYGALAQFSCQKGLTLVGTPTRRCLEIGTWSGEARCSDVICPSLAAPTNGRLLGLSRSSGSSLRVQCDLGYSSSAGILTTLTCQPTGLWLGTIPECKVISCGPPQQISGMDIILVASPLGAYNFMSRVSYRCMDKSMCLDGSSVRTCDANGKWSGAEPSCLANSCCHPGVPGNAVLKSGSVFTHGHNVFFKCNEGFRVTSGNAYRTCLPNNTWSGSMPVCKRIICDDPGQVHNAKRMGSSFLFKEFVTYLCNPGYRIKGSSVLTCQVNQTWSDPLPTCEAIPCGYITYDYSIPIQSPNYPNGIDANLSCTWLIYVPKGLQVNLRFEDFNLARDSELHFYDTGSSSPSLVFTNSSEPQPVTSSGDVVRLVFLTQSSSSHRGFQLRFQEHNCGGFLTSRSGVILSPGYPVAYPPNIDCYWTVRTDTMMRLVMSEVSLQKSSGSDYVQFRHGPFRSSMVMCPLMFGINVPRCELAYQWMWIHFHSDNAYTEKGFRLLYDPYNPFSPSV